MVIRMRSLLPALAALLLGVTSAQAQVDAFVQNQGPAIKIKVTSCVVSSVRDKAIRRDCTKSVSKLCDNTTRCELPIGLNLTDGEDIDPVGVPMVRRLGKVVTVVFQCGSTTEKRGPNLQNNNAALILAC